MLIKMRLLVFLFLSRYGLTCKYRIISKNQYKSGCRIEFPIALVLHFRIFKINLQIVQASQMVFTR